MDNLIGQLIYREDHDILGMVVSSAPDFEGTVWWVHYLFQRGEPISHKEIYMSYSELEIRYLIGKYILKYKVYT